MHGQKTKIHTNTKALRIRESYISVLEFNTNVHMAQ